MRPHLFGALLCAALGFATPALATTISLSSVSSDATPASLLDADFDFSVAGSTLTLTVTNTGASFNVTEIYFNGSGIVTSLSLVTATHNVQGDVFGAWSPVEPNSMADGFGSFDFALTDGVGETNVNLIEPGESVVFVFSITGSGGYTDADFIVANANDYLAAAKFTNGGDDPETSEVDDDDSAFGAVPEPSLSWLLGAGLLVLAARKTRA
jgi:hypothetical protein